MNKSYDKLFLAVAVLALLGGVAFYVLKSGGVASQSSGVASQPKGDHPYQAIPIGDSLDNDANWPEPEPQSSGAEWLYDVFTPPQIFIDKEGNFTAVPPKPPTPPEPFGIDLAEISHKLYRIQIQGFSGDRNKPEECVLFFFDEERQIRFFIRPGQENAEAEIKVLDFAIDREIDADNVVKVTAIATIEDQRSGKEIRLVDGERLFDSEITVVFSSEEDPEVEVELTITDLPPEGISFETPAGRYILREINLEGQTVTVEKQATEESEARTRTLLPLPAILPETTQPTEETTEATSEELDFSSFF